MEEFSVDPPNPPSFLATCYWNNNISNPNQIFFQKTLVSRPIWEYFGVANTSADINHQQHSG